MTNNTWLGISGLRQGWGMKIGCWGKPTSPPQRIWKSCDVCLEWVKSVKYFVKTMPHLHFQSLDWACSKLQCSYRDSWCFAPAFFCLFVYRLGGTWRDRSAPHPLRYIEEKSLWREAGLAWAAGTRPELDSVAVPHMAILIWPDSTAQWSLAIPSGGEWPEASSLAWSLSGQGHWTVSLSLPLAFSKSPSELQLSLGHIMRNWEGSFSISEGAANERAMSPSWVQCRKFIGSCQQKTAVSEGSAASYWSLEQSSRDMASVEEHRTEGHKGLFCFFQSLTRWGIFLSACVFPFHWPSPTPTSM